MKEEAGRIGLFYTMQRMEEPLTMVGYEIAGDVGSYLKQKNLDAKAEAEARDRD